MQLNNGSARRHGRLSTDLGRGSPVITLENVRALTEQIS